MSPINHPTSMNDVLKILDLNCMLLYPNGDDEDEDDNDNEVNEKSGVGLNGKKQRES